MRPALVPLLLTAPLASAQIAHQHDSHEHGRADLQIAYADGQLEVEFTAPGSDIVGFEHAPRDRLQHSGIEKSLETLRDGRIWLAFEPADACAFTDSNAHVHGFNAQQASSEGGHGEDDDHDHRDGHAGHDHGAGQGEDADHHGGHGEFHASLKAECAKAPVSVRVNLGGYFSSLSRVRVDFLAEDHQGRVELPGGRGEVRLVP